MITSVNTTTIHDNKSQRLSISFSSVEIMNIWSNNIPIFIIFILLFHILQL